jgi:hypothetical protein
MIYINSFVFTIDEDSFMGVQIGEKLGEYHMHCHVLTTYLRDGLDDGITSRDQRGCKRRRTTEWRAMF